MKKWFAGKIGDIVEDRVKRHLGVEDEEEDQDKDGFFSKIFDRDSDRRGDRDRDDDKGEFFSRIFGRDCDDDDQRRDQDRDRDRDDDKGGFFSRIFDRDNEEDRYREKKSGFAGLFSEQQGEPPAGSMGAAAVPGPGMPVVESDLFNDLMNAADKSSPEPAGRKPGP